MLRDQLLQLLQNYPTDVQKVIIQVVRLEREHISFIRPQVKDQVQQIIKAVADEYREPVKESADEA